MDNSKFKTSKLNNEQKQNQANISMSNPMSYKMSNSEDIKRISQTVERIVSILDDNTVDNVIINEFNKPMPGLSILVKERLFEPTS